MTDPTVSRLKGFKCFVRITGETANGMIEFDFSINDPELYVEMILPRQAFEEFCETNEVRFLTEEQGAALDADRKKWREGVSGE